MSKEAHYSLLPGKSWQLAGVEVPVSLCGRRGERLGIGQNRRAAEERASD
jgi:hypothetical protein